MNVFANGCEDARGDLGSVYDGAAVVESVRTFYVCARQEYPDA
jgi:hypothetical protein